MLTRFKKYVKRLAGYRAGTGLGFRDYMLAAVANPKMFLQAVRRYLNRRSRMVEAVVRASENPSLREPAPKAPQSFDALMKGLTAHVGVLELQRDLTTLTIGVADIDILSAVYFLATKTPGAALKLNNQKIHLGMAKIKAQIQAAKSIHIDFNGPDLDPLRIVVEIYRLAEPGKWVSSNASNRVMRAYYGDFLGTPGYNRAVDILGAPLLSTKAEIYPVDAVYTWVNDQDPEWQAMYQNWSVEGTPAVETGGEKSDDSHAISRFHNNDELRYSLRALNKHLPWLRRIFVFSNCAPPPWVRRDDPGLTWVRHEEIIPAQFLPTFNSHVIESYLHRIPDLADQFLYMNDDFFIMRGMSKKDFFTENGHQSYSRLESYGMVSGAVHIGDPDYLNAARNSAALVRTTLGFAPTQLHQHVPYALLRPVLAEIEDRFLDKISEFRENRFRRWNDVNIPSFLYHHYAMGIGRAVVSAKDSIMVKSNDLFWQERLKLAADKKYFFVCINEGGAEKPSTGWHATVQKFLQTQFSIPATWETGS